MNIAFLAHDKKKELMVQFCTSSRPRAIPSRIRRSPFWVNAD